MALFHVARGRCCAVFGTLCVLLSAHVGPAVADMCGLPNAVPPARRKNITIQESSMPFAIVPLDWPSARIVANIVSILAAEVMGLNTVVLPPVDSSRQAMSLVTGCVVDLDDGCAPMDAPTVHATFETWESDALKAKLRAAVGDRMAEDMGSMGYDGIETLFVTKKSQVAAMETEGLALEYYKSYNTFWHNPTKYFGNITQIPEEGLLDCGATRLYRSDYAELYLNVTGDAGGVERLTDGSLVMKCLGGGSGKWWLAPACRQNSSTCIPMLTSGDGWTVNIITQRAGYHGIPMALAVAKTEEVYKQTPTQVDSLLFWWKPDTAFIELEPWALRFPDSDKQQWEQGIGVTDSMKTTLRKWVNPQLSSAEARMWELIKEMRIMASRLDGMLIETKRNKTEMQAACDWLKANGQVWMPWVPFETKCKEGWGMTDAVGSFVSERSVGSSCDRCPRGRFSSFLRDTVGETHICAECANGTHQPQSGQAGCLPCEAGTYAGAIGLSTCFGCGVGSASSKVGSTGCDLCSPGTFQPVAGMTACAVCAGGSFQVEEGGTACGICPPGLYSDRNATACANCSAGRVAATAGMSSCDACTAGYVASSVGSSACSPCTIGNFADGEGLSECERCGGGAPLWTTMRKLLVLGVETWVSTDAAASEASCGCAAGSRLDGLGQCVRCVTEGIVCPGMGDVVVLPGYSSFEDLSVFRCRNAQRCPGGPPGHTCAEGREGLACARCAVGLRASAAGSCRPCGARSGGPLAAACICAVVGCVLLYSVFDRCDQSQSSYSMLLVAISSGLVIGMLQQLSVMGMLDVVYPEPLGTFLKFVKIFAFDVEEFLSLNCLGQMSAVGHFAAKISVMLFFALLINLIHCGFVVVRHQRRFSARKPILVSILGALGMAFYTSVTVTILQPFQCSINPNGKWTVSAYEDVICWSAEQDASHVAMLVIALVMLSFPMALFASVIVLVRRLPTAVRTADIEFLRSYGFLFFRFRPEVHWYVLVIMSRSLFVGMLPVVPNATGQIYLFQGALILSLGIGVRVRPWRVPWLNRLDILFGAMILQFLLVTALVAAVETPQSEAVGWISLLSVILVVALLPGFLVMSAFKRAGAVNRRYEFFLCHRKTEAGAFARWLKMELNRQPKVKRDTFLDADNLESLHQLLTRVASDVDTLVVIGTKTIYYRPWCVGEMCTAHRSGVNSVVLAMSGYKRLDTVAINDQDTLISNLGCLTENGISVDAIRETLSAFSEKPVITVPRPVGSAAMGGLAAMLARGVRSGGVDTLPDAYVRAHTLIMADSTDAEACAAAHVLEKLLFLHTFGHVDSIPRMLPPGQELPLCAKQALVVFTSGCFGHKEYVLQLLVAAERALRMLPVIMDDDFAVPSKEGLAISLRSWDCVPDQVDKATRIVLELFNSIAVTINAKRASATVLEVASHALGERLIDHRGRWRFRAPSLEAIEAVPDGATQSKGLAEEPVELPSIPSIHSVVSPRLAPPVPPPPSQEHPCMPTPPDDVAEVFESADV